MARPPTRSDAALLLIDVINLFDFEGGRALARNFGPGVPPLVRLKRRFAHAGRPVVYVNDNFSYWNAGFPELVERACRPGAVGASLVRQLVPAKDDLHVLKPRHSGFFCTSLEALLGNLGVGRLVVAGIAADACVLATVLDGHARKFDIEVPRDAVASRTRKLCEHALALMSGSGAARVAAASRLRP